MKTAVEWLVEKLIESDTKTYIHIHQLEPSKTYFNQLYEQAKQMEKEQMNKMYDHAMLSILDGNGHGQNFDEYYNETYGKN